MAPLGTSPARSAPSPVTVKALPAAACSPALCMGRDLSSGEVLALPCTTIRKETGQPCAQVFTWKFTYLLLAHGTNGWRWVNNAMGVPPTQIKELLAGAADDHAPQTGMHLAQAVTGDLSSFYWQQCMPPLPTDVVCDVAYGALFALPFLRCLRAAVCVRAGGPASCRQQPHPGNKHACPLSAEHGVCPAPSC